MAARGPSPHQRYGGEQKMKNKNNYSSVALLFLVLVVLGCSSKSTRANTNPNAGPERYGYAPITADRLKILELLREKKYPEIETQINSYLASMEKDVHNENDFWEAFETFNIDDPSLQAPLDDWVKQSPKSWVPFAARSQYLLEQGEATRGSEFANETSSKQFEEMDKVFVKAAADAQAAMKLNSRPLITYDVLMTIASYHGDIDQCKSFMEKELAISPYTFGGRTGYMMALLPRWGGSYDQMDNFAEESQKYADKNAKLRVLEGYVDWDRGRLKVGDDDPVAAIKYFTKALSYGDHWLFYTTRGGTYNQKKQFRAALADLDKAVALRPQHVDTLCSRGYARWNMGQAANAKSDIELALKLDPTNSYALQWQEVFKQLPQAKK
jgi:tetratricopeptide (TPR) repeat protein